MKRFSEINGFTHIEVSTVYCSLKSLLYEVNGIIYNYREAYAFPALVNAAKEELTAKFIEIARLNIKSPKHAKPREEILQYGRNIIKSLNEYNREFKYDNSCIEAVITSAKYQVREFLNTKDNMTIVDGEKMMIRNSIIYDIIKVVEHECDTKVYVPTFMRLQDDIKNLINKKLNTYDFAA